MGEQLHLAPVVAGRQQRLIIAAAHRVDVRAVRVLRPNAERLERERTRVRRPLNVAHGGRRRQLATRASVPWAIERTCHNEG